MLDHVLQEDYVEPVVLQGVGKRLEVVNQVGIGFRRCVDTQGARPFLGAASEVQHPPVLGRTKLELLRVLERARASEPPARGGAHLLITAKRVPAMR